MHSDTIDPQLAALAATLKVLARWAPHARHDVLGACSPISLDLSVLGVKAAKGPLSVGDINPFINRAKANVKNVVQQLDRMVLFQRQDRRPRIAVSDVMERMAHSMHTVFSSVAWQAADEAGALGSESEYDLTLTVLAVVLALFDKHGANKTLNIVAGRDQDELRLTFWVAPAIDEGWVAASAEVPASQRITIEEAQHLACHLDFVFSTQENGITLRRTAANDG
ncbi:MAG: hypothetical protein ABI583_03015 [Betaproteobacteria bacterium]